MPAHYFFRITGPLPKTIKFQFDEGQEVRSVTIIELRANGCQTMVPPSIHPDGSVLRWWGDPQTPGEPTTITGAELRAWAAQTAGAALLGRYWPAKGRRDAVARFVEAAALAAGDEEWKARGETARSTQQRLAAGETATGAKKLMGLLRGGPESGERVVAQIG